MALTDHDAHRRFGYHQPPDEETKAKHEAVRATCRVAAEDLCGIVPEGREQALVVTKLEEAMFWANAGVARFNVVDTAL